LADLVVFISAFMGLNLLSKREKRLTGEPPSDVLFAGERRKVKQIRHFPGG
jgi:hypothetical protein